MFDKTNITVNVDAETADEAEELFDELGMNLSTAVNVFLKACVRKRGIPFSLFLNEEFDEMDEEEDEDFDFFDYDEFGEDEEV